MALAGTQLAGLIGKGSNTVGGIDTTITIWGLWYFNSATGLGTTVSVQIIGQDCGDFTVAADGSVTVPLFGTTFAGVAGVVTMANLLATDGLYNIEQNCPISILNGGPRLLINVPVVIGRVYVSQGQRVRAVNAADLQTEAGPALGLQRRTDTFSALVQDAVVVQFGTSFFPRPLGNMLSQPLFPGGVDPNSGSLAPAVGYSGIIRQTLTAGGYDFVNGPSDYDDMFCWQVDRPWPFVINSVTCFLESEKK